MKQNLILPFPLLDILVQYIFRGENVSALKLNTWSGSSAYIIKQILIRCVHMKLC